MNTKQFRELIVRPTLTGIDMHSPAAENLLMGTAAQESHFEYIKQLGDGPALGFFQMEPATHDDIWDNYLEYREELGKATLIECGLSIRPPADRLMWDMRYATAMCRMHYRRVSEPLPDATDIEGMAAYWKKYYNTAYGAGTKAEFIKNYQKFGLG